jgi:tetratricopeptide (TPR) repeat protein
VTHDGVMKPRDELQARVIERLQAAHGAPVSFAELRGMGIENPALLGYELAAAGLPIEQARDTGGGALMLEPPPVDPDGDVGPAQDSSRPAPTPGRRMWPPFGLHPSRAGVAASAALTVVFAAVLALALSGHHATTTGLSADRPRGGPARSRAAPAAPRSTSVQASGAKAAAPRAPAPRTPSVAISATTAASLEADGHELLAQGRYAQAIGKLRGAVEASGGSLASCAEPTSEACLTYAYALYDLGSALRLDGDPSAAIPILSERLRIDNQRATVQAQLELARAGVT